VGVEPVIVAFALASGGLATWGVLALRRAGQVRQALTGEAGELIGLGVLATVVVCLIAERLFPVEPRPLLAPRPPARRGVPGGLHRRGDPLHHLSR
jgi:hypothetical protein